MIILLVEKLAKVFRSFASEIIEILRDDDNLREIGIRGDCVYAVYTTPNKSDELEIAIKAFYINTFMRMLNKLLKDRDLPEIKVGIGQSTAQELVVKAGRKGVGINSKIWIGKAVTRACHYADYGGKNGNPSLVFAKESYDCFIEGLALGVTNRCNVESNEPLFVGVSVRQENHCIFILTKPR